MADNEAAKKIFWTPEQKMQAFKEVVTAILALIVVGYTLHLSWTTFGYVGQEKKMADAKDLLLLMLGLSGVVIGYYFGRVPADARASLAQEQATTATAHSAEVGAKAEAMADEIVKVMDGRTDGSRGLTPEAEGRIEIDLMKVRDDLRALADFSRSWR